VYLVDNAIRHATAISHVLARRGQLGANTVRPYGRCVMDDAVVQQVRAAYARLAAGDADSFAEVLDRDVHWRGVVRGFVRKRHAY
jgi:hypothetical protein